MRHSLGLAPTSMFSPPARSRRPHSSNKIRPGWTRGLLHARANLRSLCIRTRSSRASTPTQPAAGRRPLRRTAQACHAPTTAFRAHVHKGQSMGITPSAGAGAGASAPTPNCAKRTYRPDKTIQKCETRVQSVERAHLALGSTFVVKTGSMVWSCERLFAMTERVNCACERRTSCRCRGKHSAFMTPARPPTKCHLGPYIHARSPPSVSIPSPSPIGSKACCEKVSIPACSSFLFSRSLRFPWPPDIQISYPSIRIGNRQLGIVAQTSKAWELLVLVVWEPNLISSRLHLQRGALTGSPLDVIKYIFPTHSASFRQAAHYVVASNKVDSLQFPGRRPSLANRGVDAAQMRMKSVSVTLRICSRKTMHLLLI
ncbi:hypothetical protein BCR44DRAFT_1222444 [Catenaria anguillulae PL171]|uniref:Uncharacterized protein n=1 Tax=Catenaria anguillulae PL171 TaxID=765915 RepID=A0A1Y2HE98_9FUNG|nr:hypothetical protein BCR44DRAFT_1222444 [Catenaria anguillulae PL171]